MPNNKGGRGYKKGGKKKFNQKKEFILKDENQNEEYGYISSILGNGRFRINCMDSKERLGIVPGKLRKRVWFNNKDLVLICKWDFQDDKCNLIHKYENEDEQKLLSMDQITDSFVSQNKDKFTDVDDYDSNLFGIDNSDSETDDIYDTDDLDENKSSEWFKNENDKNEEIDLDDI